MNSIRENLSEILNIVGATNCDPIHGNIIRIATTPKELLDELETYINKVREEAEQKGYFAGLQANQMKDWIVKSSDKTEPLQPIKEQPKSLDQKADEEMEMNRR